MDVSFPTTQQRAGMDRMTLAIHDDARCVILLPRDGSAARITDFGAADEESALRLLEACASWCTGRPGMLGPIGADTWSDYRFVVESDGQRPFIGEPQHPDWYPGVWERAGFAPVSTYASAIDERPRDLVRTDRPVPAEARRWSADGSKEVLEDIHRISELAFSRAPYFAPIAREVFVDRFAKTLSGPAGRHSAFATIDGAVVGYVLGYPDGRGGHVLKTLVSMRPGVGTQMIETFYDMAIEAGSTHVVHALMHEDNHSLAMSRRLGARVFRRYALFGKDLAR